MSARLQTNFLFAEMHAAVCGTPLNVTAVLLKEFYVHHDLTEKTLISQLFQSYALSNKSKLYLSTNVKIPVFVKTLNLFCPTS